MSYSIELLGKQHQRKDFDCGQTDLNDFIKLYALQQQKRNQNKTYVAYTDTQQVIGFYSLNVGAISFEEMPPDMQKRLARYPVPTLYVGRFAVDSRFQGQGLGKWLMQNTQAAQFYQSVDFRPLPNNPLKLFLPVSDLQKA